MRVLGIDPGLHLTGYGCVEMAPGRPASLRDPLLVEAGVLRLKQKTSVAFRVAQLFEDLASTIDELSPDLVAVEKLFAHYRHPRTSVIMGHARGVVLLAAQQRGIEICELAATEVKKSITGNGHASKVQMQRAVASQCGLVEVPQPPDVADAIGIALCAARRVAEVPVARAE